MLNCLLTQIEKQNCLQVNVKKYKKKEKRKKLLSALDNICYDSFCFTYVHLYIHEFLLVEIGFLLKEVEPKTLFWDFKFSQQDMSSTVYFYIKGLPIFPYLSLNFRKNGQLKTTKNIDPSKQFRFIFCLFSCRKCQYLDY